MRSAFALALLALASCGGAGSPPLASLGLALSSGTAAEIRELQVELVNAPGVDCSVFASACFKDAGIPSVPFAGAQAGQKVFRTAFTQEDSGKALDLQVTPGTYLVNVEALDASGMLVQTGCGMNVSFGSAATVPVRISLAPFAGPSCDAAM